MKGAVLGALLFVAAFVLFPYVGMLTCSLDQGPATATHPRFQRSNGILPFALRGYVKKDPVSELNASVEDMMEDQMERIEHLCTSRGANSTVYENRLVIDLYHHLLVDDARKLLFCYIPKVACSNWKRVFLIFTGLVDPNETLRPSIEIFRKVKSLEDFSPSEQEYRLRRYFKFMFIRNPSERIVSAYRNKIEHPINDNPSERSLWDNIRTTIMQVSRGITEVTSMNEPPYPTFSEFVKFFSDSDPADMNEHYKPMSSLCQPCSVHYNYIGNFATLRRDADRILDYLHVNISWFWDRGRHVSNPTQNHVDKYYSQLPANDIELIESFLEDDILLYKHLFS